MEQIILNELDAIDMFHGESESIFVEKTNNIDLEEPVHRPTNGIQLELDEMEEPEETIEQK